MSASSLRAALARVAPSLPVGVGALLVAAAGWGFATEIAERSTAPRLGPFSSLLFALLPLFAGLVVTVAKPARHRGWILLVVGAAGIFGGAVYDQSLLFRSTTLHTTLGPLVLLAIGFGLLARDQK